MKRIALDEVRLPPVKRRRLTGLPNATRGVGMDVRNGYPHNPYRHAKKTPLRTVNIRKPPQAPVVTLSSLQPTSPSEPLCTQLEAVLALAIRLLPANTGLRCLHHDMVEREGAMLVGECVRVMGTKEDSVRWHTAYVMEVSASSIVCYFPNPIHKNSRKPVFCEIKHQPYYFVDQLTIATLRLQLSQAADELPKNALELTALCKQLLEMQTDGQWLEEQRGLDDIQSRKSFFAEFWKRMCKREHKMTETISRLEMERVKTRIESSQLSSSQARELLGFPRSIPRTYDPPGYVLCEHRTRYLMTQPTRYAPGVTPAIAPASIAPRHVPAKPFNQDLVFHQSPPVLPLLERASTSTQHTVDEPDMTNIVEEGAAFFKVKATEYLGTTKVPKEFHDRLASVISNEMRGPFAVDSLSKEQFWKESVSWVELELKERWDFREMRLKARWEE